MCMRGSRGTVVYHIVPSGGWVQTPSAATAQHQIRPHAVPDCLLPAACCLPRRPFNTSLSLSHSCSARLLSWTLRWMFQHALPPASS